MSPYHSQNALASDHARQNKSAGGDWDRAMAERIYPDALPGYLAITSDGAVETPR